MPWKLSAGESGLLSRELDFRPLLRWVKEHPTHVLIGLGIFLRVWEYLGNRSYWLDESSLLGNLTHKAVFDFSGTFSGDQLAPFGFIVIERCVHWIFDYETYSMRLFPLLCGIAALVMFSRLAKQALAPGAALTALALFSLSSDLIYYSNELKQYSTDLALSLLVTLVARDMLDRPVDLKSGVRLLALAVVSPWISFSSSFVVAGAGATLLLQRLGRRCFREAAAFAAVGSLWGISFALCYRATRAMLSQYTTMYIFWDFAFLPFPPRSQEGLWKFCGIWLDVFVNPLNMVAPVFPSVGVVVPILMLAIGGGSLWRRDRALLALLVLPVLLAIVASGMKKYPFHGRLILELVPPFFLLMAEGTEWVRLLNPARPWIYRTNLILLLVYPLANGLIEGLSRSPRNFDIHGDLRHNLFLHENMKPVIPRPPERRSPDRRIESGPNAPIGRSAFRGKAWELNRRDLDPNAAVHGRFMGAESDHRPVGRGLGVGERRPISLDGGEEGMDQMRVRAAVAAPLEEREVVGVLDLGRFGEPANPFGEKPRVIGDGDPLGDLGLGERFFRRVLGVDHRFLALDLLPLEAFLAAGRVEALAVLPGNVEQAPGHLGDHVGIPDRECGGLDREGAAVFGDQLLTDPARAVADDAVGMSAHKRQTGAHAVCCVPHRWKARPVAGPAVHVLLVAAAEELEPAQLARVI
jgi:hypothetical protein